MKNKIRPTSLLLILLGLFCVMCNRVEGISEERTLAECRDGIDNDGDGGIDCFDADCVDWGDCDSHSSDQYFETDSLTTPPTDTSSSQGNSTDTNHTDTNTQMSTDSETVSSIDTNNINDTNDIDTNPIDTNSIDTSSIDTDVLTSIDSETGTAPPIDITACGGLVPFDNTKASQQESIVDSKAEECCTEVAHMGECWMENAKDDGITCSDTDLSNCTQGYGCTPDGLCACGNSCHCNDGYCSTAGFCVPSYCNGYSICSCWGGCQWWDGSDPTNTPDRNANEVGLCCIENEIPHNGTSNFNIHYSQCEE